MTHFVGGNQIQLLRGGTEYFPALEAAIENAEHEVYLQTYIYAADKIGLRIGNALKQAALRGVSVHLLLDGFGCKDLPSTYIQALELAGVQVMFYRKKISPWTFKKNRLRRLHHKVAVIDGLLGFVGGINIVDDYELPNNTWPRVDYAVCIKGSLLPMMVASVHKLWRHMARSHLQRVTDAFTEVSSRKKLALLAGVGGEGAKAAFVLRDNILHRRDIEAAYLAAIADARSEIIIANAYFVPGRAFRQALLTAALRGVRVKLLLQGRMEYFLMFATHAFYHEFLRNGIEIYEYRKSFMHSKVAVIDGFWATVGSSNIDPFSLLLAREANVIVQDAAFAMVLRTDVMLSIDEGAHRISSQAWAQGNMAKRVASWVAYGLVRLFLGVIGRAND